MSRENINLVEFRNNRQVAELAAAMRGNRREEGPAWLIRAAGGRVMIR